MRRTIGKSTDDKWTTMVKRAIGSKTLAEWQSVLEERWDSLLRGDERPCIWSEGNLLDFHMRQRLTTKPKQYAVKDLDHLLLVFARKFNIDQERLPVSITVSDAKLDIRPTSSCQVDYMGKRSRIGIEGAKGIVAGAVLKFKDRTITTKVFHRFIGKTFHQYVRKDSF